MRWALWPLAIWIAVVLFVRVSAADTCRDLPTIWNVTPGIVRMSVVKGLNERYVSPVPYDADAEEFHACMLSKVDFFVDSIILHCKMGIGADTSEQTAFNALLNLCAKELGYD